jgi:ribosomal protein S11
MGVKVLSFILAKISFNFMILSNIVVNNNKKIYIYKLVELIKFLNLQKTSREKSKKMFNNIKKFTITNKKISSVKQNVISYIINIVLSPTNTIVNVTDINGNVIVSISAGLINLTKFQKKSQPMALLNIFKILLSKSKFLQNKAVALHFKNVKRFHESFFITALKKKLFIKSFQSYNLTPHNGCRPKKIKRIKRRTKRLVLK